MQPTIAAIIDIIFSHLTRRELNPQRSRSRTVLAIACSFSPADADRDLRCLQGCGVSSYFHHLAFPARCLLSRSLASEYSPVGRWLIGSIKDYLRLPISPYMQLRDDRDTD